MTKKYLSVAYEDRDFAKRLGARWDPAVKKWHCPAGSPLEKIFSWRAAQKPIFKKTPIPVQDNFELPLAS